MARLNQVWQQASRRTWTGQQQCEQLPWLLSISSTALHTDYTHFDSRRFASGQRNSYVSGRVSHMYTTEEVVGIVYWYYMLRLELTYDQYFVRNNLTVYRIIDHLYPLSYLSVDVSHRHYCWLYLISCLFGVYNVHLYCVSICVWISLASTSWVRNHYNCQQGLWILNMAAKTLRQLPQFDPESELYQRSDMNKNKKH